MKYLFDCISNIYNIPNIKGILNIRVPHEFLSTCGNCPMLNIKRQETVPFSKSTKCCTWFPFLPNYLVGAILNDDDPLLIEGKKRILDNLINNYNVTYFGIFPSDKFQKGFSKLLIKDFGRDEKCRCDFFMDGKVNCSIWKYRDAVCSTWYCKPIANITGSVFWNYTKFYLANFQDYLLAEVLDSQMLNYEAEFYRNHKILIKKDQLNFKKNIGQFRIFNKYRTIEERVNFFIECYKALFKINTSALKKYFSKHPLFNQLLIESEKLFSIQGEIKINKNKITKNICGNNIQLNSCTSISLSNEQLQIVKNWNKHKQNKNLVEFEELMVCLKYHNVI